MIVTLANKAGVTFFSSNDENNVLFLWKVWSVYDLDAGCLVSFFLRGKTG